MQQNIDWLPNIERLENYMDGDGNFDFVRLIQNRMNDLLNDFFNETSPIMFNGARVFLDTKILNCNKLKIKSCYNQEFYTCENCPFENQLDILNHIFTIEYDEKKLKKKNGKLKLKKEYKKSGDKAIPRTPREFCIPRVLLSSWIKPIILNSDDCENVIISPKNSDNTYTLELKHRKYKIHLKEIINKNGYKYYKLKSAYYYTNPKELIDFENMKFIKNAIKRRNATSGVSTTPCIDL